METRADSLKINNNSKQQQQQSKSICFKGADLIKWTKRYASFSDNDYATPNDSSSSSSSSSSNHQFDLLFSWFNEKKLIFCVNNGNSIKISSSADYFDSSSSTSLSSSPPTLSSSSSLSSSSPPPSTCNLEEFKNNYFYFKNIQYPPSVIPTRKWSSYLYESMLWKHYDDTLQSCLQSLFRKVEFFRYLFQSLCEENLLFYDCVVHHFYNNNNTPTVEGAILIFER
eukprot:TRINITY_DN3738_c0_g2_i4.p2 TRINITY_DN3738_c0_g2~~TRINITY_DN3738_c0_g2_i4.p2  ORF type:complete len:226 (-),score=77.30 TRINITY_DN3738_c0_g2_i4:943-1620(-)